MTENKMLKGAHLALNQEVLNFLQGALENVFDQYTDELAEKAPEEILEALELAGWSRLDDSFGKKVFTTTPFSCGRGTDGKLRVGIVLPKRSGVLAIDIRPWGEY